MVAGVVTMFSTRLRKLPANIGAAIDSLETQVVKVQLNGELREVPEGLTLAALLEWLELPRDRVAVERNREIVPRTGWDVTPIQPGDRLEVVHLVGGGLE
jgi:thiamine biosynthesis protein ThiS